MNAFRAADGPISVCTSAPAHGSGLDARNLTASSEVFDEPGHVKTNPVGHQLQAVK